MLSNLLILARFSLIFFFLLPLVVHFFKDTKKEKLCTFITTIGISLGLGSFFLFIAFLVNGRLVNQTSSFYFLIFIFFLSLLIYKKETIHFFQESCAEFKRRLQSISFGGLVKFFFDGPIGMVRLLVFVLLLYIFIRGIFFPISQWDDLVRYAAWGHSIFARGEIGVYINSYPLLVPLLYTYGFLSSGFRNDYLIKLIPLVFGFLTLGITYLMINNFFENKKDLGLIGIFFTLCFLPFVDWFHLGYADIASSFYFVGTFYFIYLYSKIQQKKYLFLAGLFLGLSLWVKQQTVVIFVSVFFTFLLFFINKRAKILESDFKFSFKDSIFLVLISLPFFLPWYLRDLFLVGVPLQLPVLESSVTLEDLFLPFIKNWESVGYFPSAFFQLSLFFSVFYLFKPTNTGIVFKKKYLCFLGLFLITLALLKLIFEEHPRLTSLLSVNQRLSLFLGLFLIAYGFYFPKTVIFRLRNVLSLVLIWLLPYYLAWWLKYTTVFRYLITIIPLFVILFIYAYDRFFSVIKEKIKLSKVSELLMILFAISFVLPRFSDALAFKGLTYLFADTKTKGLKTVDNSFVVGEYLADINLEEGRPLVISTDNRLAYYAPNMNFYNITPAYLSDLQGFDYYILNPWTKEAYDLRKKKDQEVYTNLVNENPNVFEKVYEYTPYKVYKIILKKSDFLNLPKESYVQLDKNTQRINSINLVYVPKILPGQNLYGLKRIRDNFVLYLDKVFYNGDQTIISIASKRLLEAYEVCLFRNQCDLSTGPLTDYRSILQMIGKRSFNETRLLIDENYSVMSELENCFDDWIMVLAQLFRKQSSVSLLAEDILKNELTPLIEKYRDQVARKEPKFAYYDKQGKLINSSNKEEKQ